MSIKGIVAVDQNWCIGRTNKETGKGELLFHLKKDMQFFKEKTLYSIVVMGENTLLSLPGGKPLKDRINIVLCPEGHNYDGCFCVHNLEDLLNYLKVLIGDVYVIGGGMLYKSMLPYYDEVLVTKVQADGNGTVFFPNLDENSDFKLSSCSQSEEDSGYTINFCTYTRVENV